MHKLYNQICIKNWGDYLRSILQQGKRNRFIFEMYMA